MPQLPVEAVCVMEVPSGLRQVTFTITPETAELAASRTTTWPVYADAVADACAGKVDGSAAKRFRCRGRDGDGQARTLAAAPELSVTVSVAVYVPALA